MKYYTQRAQDALDLVVVTDVYLTQIKAVCKGAVAHAAQRHVDRLKQAKFRLERELETLQAKTSSFFSWFKKVSQVRELKKQLAHINFQLVNWINTTYRYFVA